MALFPTRLGYKVTMKFIRNFNVSALNTAEVSQRAKNDRINIKVSVPARFALDLKGKWHPVGPVLDKIDKYQGSFKVSQRIQDIVNDRKNMNRIVYITWMALVVGGLYIGHDSESLNVHKGFTMTGIITGLVFIGKYLGVANGAFPMGFGKNETGLYNYLLELNHKEPFDLKKEMKKSD